MFKVKMFILDKLQNLLLIFGAYIRPRRLKTSDFITSFLEPKNVGLEMVLIGDGRDGSYVLPDDPKGIKFCFSPGVGPTSQFETEIFDIYGIHSYLIDASVNSVPGERNDFYKFERKFLGATSYNEFISLDDWVNENDAMFEKNDLLLQMDIEGHEFVSLFAADDQTLCRFRIIASKSIF